LLPCPLLRKCWCLQWSKERTLPPCKDSSMPCTVGTPLSWRIIFMTDQMLLQPS
jgi:hypothetical protein